MARLNKIGSHATSIGKDDKFITVRYHSTDVVKFSDNEIILNSGGWRTNTTKTRINQASNQYDLGLQVMQKDFDWFVMYNGQKIDFTDNMVIKRS